MIVLSAKEPTMFFLRVNGLAATSLSTRKVALAKAAAGLATRPDCVVELFKLNPKDHRDVFVARIN
jgi:hypothetical protein